ncbi:3-deoxy-7-phosphoheptulonate synthase [Actinosynnema sp. NPDC049800]
MANSSEPGGTTPTVHPPPQRVGPEHATPDVALTPPTPRQGGTRRPDQVEQLEQPEQVEQAARSAQDGQAGQAAQAVQIEQSAQADQVEQSAQADQVERSGQAAGSAQTERSAHTAPPAHTARPDQATRSGQAASSIQPQRSGWADERRVRAQRAGTPALVLPQQCDRLTAELGQVATGQALLLHGGPGAAASDDVSGYRFTRELALVLGHAACLPVITVGRVVADGPDTRRRYRNSARYLDELRALVSDPATADAVRESLDRRLATTPAAARHADVVALVRSRLAGPHPGPPDLFVSHEAVPLDYELALARTDPRTGRRFGTSGHLLWAGDRSRTRVDFLAGIDNPVAVALGPTATARDAAGLARALNPDRVPGRLTFITRLGAGQVRDVLPRLLDAVTDTGVPVGWVCDPLHGNASPAGDLDDVVAEVQGFHDAHRAAGTHAGGLHVELVDDVSTDDQRLDRDQALELALWTAERCAR